MSASADSGPQVPLGGFWHCRSLRADGSVAAFAVVRSERHADGERIDLPEHDAAAQIGHDALCVIKIDPSGRIERLAPTPLAAPKAPPLWFAEFTQPDDRPPAVGLMAFTGHDVAAGTLVDRAELRGLSVTGADQLGALRWWPESGEVDQIYVSPKWRRRSIGTALLVAGGSLSVARGGHRLWGDGQRTSDGERMRKASQWSHRAEPLTNLAPPMTPFDERDDQG